jgi:hypothetical protein
LELEEILFDADTFGKLGHELSELFRRNCGAHAELFQRRECQFGLSSARTI